MVAGVGIGMLMGFFGVGGSSVATPFLAVLGFPALVVIASPLPATIPAAALAGYSYLRSGDARPRAAAWSLLGGVPGTLIGALVSRRVDGQVCWRCRPVHDGPGPSPGVHPPATRR